MLRIEKIDHFDDFEKMEPVWDTLLIKSLHDLVFSSFDFIKTEWEHLGWELDDPTELYPFILTIKEDNEILAIFPFVKQKVSFYGFSANCIRPLTQTYVDRCDFILVKKPVESFKAVIEFLKKKEDSWNFIIIRNLDAESYLVKHGFPLMSVNFGLIDGYHSPYVERQTDWKSYLQKRSKNFHKTLSNKINRVKKMGGELHAKQYKSPSDIEFALNIAFDIASKSWKAKVGTAISSTDKRKDYWRALLLRVSQNGLVRIWILWLNDKPIAFEYHIIYQNRVYSLKWGYDQEYQNISPGFLLKYNSMKSFWKEKIVEVDLLGSTDSFKEKWTEKKRKHYNVYIFNNNIYSYLIYFVLFRLRVYLLKGLHFIKSNSP